MTIKTEDDKRGDVYSCLSSRRGRVISDEIDYGKMITIKGHMPVAESFGFATYLRDNTQGKAHPMTAFSHWETIQSDPYQEPVFKHLRSLEKFLFVGDPRLFEAEEDDFPSQMSFLDVKLILDTVGSLKISGFDLTNSE